MNYLLDTHTLIWSITDPQQLSDTVKAILEDIDNEIMVSAVSFWEIAFKQSIKKLTLDGLVPEDFPKAALETGYRLIDLTGTTAASYHQLSAIHHRDPFDRMLIWQAMQNNFQLISKDEQVTKYADAGLNVIW